LVCYVPETVRNNGMLLVLKKKNSGITSIMGISIIPKEQSTRGLSCDNHTISWYSTSYCPIDQSTCLVYFFNPFSFRPQQKVIYTKGVSSHIHGTRFINLYARMTVMFSVCIYGVGRRTASFTRFAVWGLLLDRFTQESR
jgi:hypothetical protein